VKRKGPYQFECVWCGKEFQNIAKARKHEEREFERKMGISKEKFFELDDWLKEHPEMSQEEKVKKLQEKLSD